MDGTRTCPPHVMLRSFVLGTAINSRKGNRYLHGFQIVSSSQDVVYALFVGTGSRLLRPLLAEMERRLPSRDRNHDHDSEMTLTANLRSQLLQTYHHVYSEK